MKATRLSMDRLPTARLADERRGVRVDDAMLKHRSRLLGLVELVHETPPKRSASMLRLCEHSVEAGKSCDATSGSRPEMATSTTLSGSRTIPALLVLSGLERRGEVPPDRRGFDNRSRDARRAAEVRPGLPLGLCGRDHLVTDVFRKKPKELVATKVSGVRMHVGAGVGQVLTWTPFLGAL